MEANIMIDNTKTTSIALAQYILDNAPPNSMRQRDIDELTSVVENGGELDYVNITFRREDDSPTARAEADLYIRLEREGDRFEGPDGGRWERRYVKAKTNWASFGSMDPQLAAKRLALMVEVNNLALHINNTFSQEVLTLIQTKEEKEAAQKASEDLRLQRRLTTALEADNNKKRVRCGAGFYSDFQAYKFAPDGKYTVEGPWGRKYTVQVDHNSESVLIVRVK